MPKCAYKTCPNNSLTKQKNEGISYFAFPRNEIIKEKWRIVVATERGDAFYKPNKSSVVCSEHFLDTDLYVSKAGLQMKKKSAIPQSKSAKTEIHVDVQDTSVTACRVCLSTDTRLYAIREAGMEEAFVKLTGVLFSPQDGLPSHLCYLCRAELSKCASFHDRCQRARDLLQTLKEWGPIKMSDISAIDRHAHKLTLDLTQSKVHKFDSNPNEIVTKITDNEETITNIGDLENCNDNYEIVIKKESQTNDERAFNNDITESLVKQETNGSETSKDNTKVASERLLNNVIELEIQEKPNEIARDVSDDEISEPFGEETCDHITKSKVITRTIKRKRSGGKVSVELKSNTIKKPIKKLDKTKGTNPKVAKVRGIRNYKFDKEVDFVAFQKQYNVTMRVLTEEEQRREIEAMKLSDNYLKWPFRCEFCGKGYNFEDTFRNHMTYHDPRSGTFECGICRLRFRRNSLRATHCSFHRVLYTCDTCGATIRGQRQRVVNHFEAHNGKTYKCLHCHKEYSKKTSRLNHMRLAHPSENVACDQCGETFLSARGVSNHKNKAHRLVTIKPNTDTECATCRIQFRDLEALDKHTRTATDAAHASCKPCASCGENCRDDEALAAHATECRRRDDFHCGECDKTFSNALSYDTHHRRKHLNQPPHSYRRGRHYTSDSKPRAPFPDGLVCDVCGKLLKSRIALVTHIGAHKGIRPFACETCDKAFATKFRLQLHSRTHTGEKPYQCTRCSRRFNAPSNLKRHFNALHSGKRPYACSLCGKAFAWSDSLNAHVRYVHRREQPKPRQRKSRVKTTV